MVTMISAVELTTKKIRKPVDYSRLVLRNGRTKGDAARAYLTEISSY